VTPGGPVIAPIGGATRVGAVLGWPVAHSASPALHNAAFRALGIDAVFVALPVAPADLPAAVRGLAALGMLGASVTVPHKQAIAALCDVLDPSAERVGAVNCLVLAGGRVVGHNTDAGGFTDALRGELERDPRGARAVLLGAGGAARAVAVALAEAGAARVDVVARAPGAVAWCAAHPWTAATLAALLPACDLLVDCTPVGLAREQRDQAGAVPAEVPIDLLPAGAAAVALSYGAQGSALLGRARVRGLAAMDGAAMLVHQGARAFTLWTGQPAPLAVMHAALAGR
jgi:shikimate dehydrogenase